ncbi:MAG: hypothetical protein PWP76_351 [Candidatus Diapherotrites archaeon]|nr:hypothetical protein [Candidatus Diapherotrites archaeon]
MRPETKEWIRLAQRDFDAAQVLFGRQIYDLAVFHAHQAVEKALKALWIEKYREEPPKTHNIQYLAKELGLNVRSAAAEIADAYYVTRYPVPGVGTIEMDRATAERKMNAAKEIYDKIIKILLK